ncbi:MAG: 30S ribosomal protein S12 methylthiotransferase RimO [Erysipelotrichales bacterium]|nr:30S ribosomal protein S12 methylthiotransferase RimO [Erysipelotrichales bacterium]
MKRIGIVSLGCAKNLVDSEMILGMLKDGGYEIVNNPSDADAIIVNTCGFILDAKQESIDTILEMAKYKKKLIVVGCLAQRYEEDLKKELPEVDLFVSIRDYPHIAERINALFNDNSLQKGLCPTSRVLATPKFTAYLKISEGCNNCCTYCAIPLIRGSFRSRPLDELIEEAKMLASRGVKELVVISQDTTRYGTDIDDKTTIVTLLNELLKIKEFDYIRMLYLYPNEITDELLALIGKEKRLTPYFDMPIQHASSRILKAMNRRGDKEFLKVLFERTRKFIPNAVLRTTIIVGFPGETEEDFNELLEFIQEVQFDHLGAFTYSREEDTIAYSMDNQIEDSIKNDRLNRLMKVQRKISYDLNKKRIGEIMEGLIVAKKGSDNYEFRSGWNAPDDVDGKILVTSRKPLDLGDKVKVKITDAFAYDLYGEVLN